MHLTQQHPQTLKFPPQIGSNYQTQAHSPKPVGDLQTHKHPLAPGHTLNLPRVPQDQKELPNAETPPNQAPSPRPGSSSQNWQHCRPQRGAATLSPVG